MDPHPDPDRRIRWIQGIVGTMVLSGSIGLMAFLLGDPWRTRWSLEEALVTAAGVTAVSFWVIFPILYFFTIRKGVETPRDDLHQEERTWTGGRY